MNLCNHSRFQEGVEQLQPLFLILHDTLSLFVYNISTACLCTMYRLPCVGTETQQSGQAHWLLQQVHTPPTCQHAYHQPDCQLLQAAFYRV